MEVFLANPWIPREWVEVHGLIPRGLFCAPAFGAAVPHAAQGVCSFAQKSLEFALAQGCDGSAVVFGSACDQMRRSFDLIDGAKANVFLFNLPATWQSEAAQRLFRIEFERFTRFLERVGGHKKADECVESMICAACEARSRLGLSWNKLRARDRAEAMAVFHWDGRVTVEPSSDFGAGSGIPVGLVGGPLTRAYFGILDVIESAGGCVVLDGTETGERSLGLEAAFRDGIAGDMDQLARFFFSRVVDVWQRPNTRLYSWLGERIAERKVRGIVLWHHVGCDLWRAEAATLREVFNLPILILDSEQAHFDHPRLVHRVAAFMEMLW